MSETSQTSLVLLPLTAAIILLLIAALSDITRYLIPNWLCLVLAVLSIPFFFLASVTAESALIRLGIGVMVLVSGLMLHARGFVGGGDIKLLAALSLWLAPAMWPLFMLMTMVFGGVLALLVLLLRKMKTWFPENATAGKWLGMLLTENGGIPYGVAISMAGIVSLAEGLKYLKLLV